LHLTRSRSAAAAAADDDDDVAVDGVGTDSNSKVQSNLVIDSITVLQVLPSSEYQ